MISEGQYIFSDCVREGVACLALLLTSWLSDKAVHLREDDQS